MKEYTVLNGISYHKDTDINVINILDSARENNLRVRLWYGKDGVSWDEENDTIGTIGSSTGERKIPLLIKNRRSSGGGGILDNCIVKIINVKTGELLYQHPKFRQAFFEADDTIVWKNKKERYPSTAEIWATCETWEKAKRLAKFMNGERHSK